MSAPAQSDCVKVMLRLLAVCFMILGSASAQEPRFEEHALSRELKGGYQVVPFDINGDGRVDLIALAPGEPDIVWLENPSWQRHVIVSNLPHPINLAAYLNSDSKPRPEIVLAYGFSNIPKRSSGNVAVLRPREDVKAPWELTKIDHLPTSHRLRVADIDGSGHKVIVNAPLADASADPPDYRGHVPLVYYRPGIWKRESIGNAEEGILHGIYISDWDGNGRDSVLIGSFLGIHLYRYGSDGLWSRNEITKGDPAPWPKSGTSDVAVGKLGSKRFIAAIEPWHGNEVVLYTQQSAGWKREVVDDSLADAHTVVTGDFDGDGNDEIIAGFRGKPYGVNLYRWTAGKWTRQILDQGGMAAAACSVTDLDADKQPDLVCIGSATANLKWYRNIRRGK